MTPTHPFLPQPQSFLDRVFERIALTRFFTASLLFHLALVLFAGSAVIFQVHRAVPDFVAGPEGIITEAIENNAPPEAPASETPQDFKPTTAEAPVVPLSTIVASNSSPSSLPLPETSLRGFSESLEAAAEKSSRAAGDAAAAVAAAAGRAGGGKMGMIFGKKVEATKLGVILDVSGSAQPHIAPAVAEIEKSFADALTILYPGCGMLTVKGRHLHEMRKFASIRPAELDPDVPPRSTAGQLVKALQIPEFAQLTKDPARKDRLFVSWYQPEPSGASNLVTQTQLAFEYLISHGADAVYWFSDFKDPVEPEASAALLKRLKSKKVRVYLHNFADDLFPPEVAELATETGGTLDPAPAVARAQPN